MSSKADRPGSEIPDAQPTVGEYDFRDMSGWIERYIAGAHEHVWAEMTSMGDKLRGSPTGQKRSKWLAKRCGGPAQTSND